ncbi:TPA_asm: hypothetical protein GEV19_02830 [Listeria monocytogenes]|nr:hypothetical protein [Listeria monocytogenes]
MPIDKIGNMKLETSAYYVTLGDTNIKFWNMDIKTAILRFQVTRNKVVLPLGKNNVQAYITLFASDGSNITDDLVIEDELNGVISYTIPKEFLAHTGIVRGQVYISVNGTEETVTEADFTLEIKDALINKIPSETKISYIRIFDDLKTVINQKVAEILAKIEAGQDIVTAIEAARDDAVQKINSAVSGAKTDIDTKVATATTNLNKTATDTTKAITDTAKSATDSIDADLKDFKNTVATNGFLKPSDVANYQKIALTGADGVAKRISNADCNTLTEPGFYYLPSPINQPNGWGGLYLLVIPGSVANTTAYYKHIGFQYATGKIATRDRKSGAIGDTSLWTDWTEMETTAGSTQKVATLKDLLLDLAPSLENGGVKMSVSATQDVLEQYGAMKSGTFGVYVAAGAANGHPSGRASRGIAMKSAANIGLLILVDTAGKIASNYLNQTSWSGWQMAGQTLLWSGNAVAKKGTVFTLSQSKENFIDLKLLVSINTVGDDICWMNARGTNNASLRSSNAFDDASGDMLYEITLEKTSTTKLTVINEARINHSTNNGLVNNNDWTIKEIWGMN